MDDFNNDRTFNKFVVAMSSQGIVIMNPPNGPLSSDDALNLAAWLVALGDARQGNFQALLDEIQSS